MNVQYLTQAILDIAIIIIMVFASKADIKTRVVPPKYQLAIAVVSVAHLIITFVLQGFGVAFKCVLVALGVFAIYIVMVLVFRTGIGGADTKMTTLMSLYLGVWGTVYFILGHFVSAVVYVVFKKIKDKETVSSVALMPFLLSGFLISEIISWITIFIK